MDELKRLLSKPDCSAYRLRVALDDSDLLPAEIRLPRARPGQSAREWLKRLMPDELEAVGRIAGGQ